MHDADGLGLALLEGRHTFDVFGFTFRLGSFSQFFLFDVKVKFDPFFE